MTSFLFRVILGRKYYYFGAMNSRSLRFFRLILLVPILVFGSCTFQKTSFTNQKFTKLKTLHHENVSRTLVSDITSHDENDKVCDSLSNQLDCDTIYFKNGKVMVCSIISRDAESISFTDCPPTEKRYELPKSKVIPNDHVQHYDVSQEDECETIFLENGDSLVGKITSQTDYYLKYVKCCDSCKAEYTHIFEKPTVRTVEKQKRYGPLGLLLLGLLALVVGGFLFTIYFAAIFYIGWGPAPTPSTFEKISGFLGFTIILLGVGLLVTSLVRFIKKLKAKKKGS